MTALTSPPQDLRIGWVGFHMEGIPALQALLAMGVRIEGIITLKGEACSRRSASVNYASALGAHDVPIHEIGNINDDDALAILRRMELDVVFVIGWSQILRPAALAAARLGMIGAHASLLPHNRGSAPINWALIRGEASAGNSLIWLSEEVDDGRVIDQIEFPISIYDTCATLYDKVAETNRTMIMRLLPRLFAGETPGQPQSPTDEPILPRRRPSDGVIDWDRPCRSVYDFVRALTKPYPGAFSWLDGKRWIIWNCALLPEGVSAGGQPGQVLGSVVSPVESACGQLVACEDGAVLLLEVEDPEAPGSSMLRGRSLSEQDWRGKIWQDG
jgi:methionyl-tRNA formyltransferase